MLLDCWLISSCTTEQKDQKLETVENKKPNIVIIYADDIGHDAGCYGVKDIKTPEIDQLAAQGYVLLRHMLTPFVVPLGQH